MRYCNFKFVQINMRHLLYKGSFKWGVVLIAIMMRLLKLWKKSTVCDCCVPKGFKIIISLIVEILSGEKNSMLVQGNKIDLQCSPFISHHNITQIILHLIITQIISHLIITQILI